MQNNNTESIQKNISTPYMENTPPDKIFALYEEGIQLVRQHSGYDLGIRDITPMIYSYKSESEISGIENALYHAIGTAYYMGIAKGVRMQKKHPKQ